jgi:predicted Zn-dependent protease with MMP-like domain
MLQINDEEFQSLIDEAFGELPKRHTENLKNVALLYEDEPTLEQREKLQLRDDQSLYGLYEGVPLALRQGQQAMYPDKITLFKLPLLMSSPDLRALKANIKHTLWHEIGHYYGLDHDRIHEIERGWK